MFKIEIRLDFQLDFQSTFQHLILTYRPIFTVQITVQTSHLYNRNISEQYNWKSQHDI